MTAGVEDSVFPLIEVQEVKKTAFGEWRPGRRRWGRSLGGVRNSNCPTVRPRSPGCCRPPRRNLGVQVGANLMLSSTVLRSFPQVIELLAQVGLDNLTFLRYKPPASAARWARECPSPEAMRRFV